MKPRMPVQTQVRWGLAVGIASWAACASAGDSPGASDTELTASASATASTTSTTDATSSSESTSSTTTTSDDTETSTTSTGTDTSDCLPGEDGCPCRDDEPACDDELVCVLDECAQSYCADEADEPNDTPEDAVDLGTHEDGAPPMNVVSQLDGPLDVDWFTYRCTDTAIPVLDPMLVIDQTTEIRVCMFLDCVIGGNPLFDCPDGTTAEMAPFGFLPGCCVTDGSTIDLTDYNCPDSSDDSVDVWVRVDMGDTMVCEPYSLTYDC
jgi:hypothetical protein